MNLLDVIEPIEVPGQPDSIQHLKCKLCGEFIAQPDIDAGNMTMLPVAIQAHFGVRHEIQVEFHHCNDPKCLGEGS